MEGKKIKYVKGLAQFIPLVNREAAEVPSEVQSCLSELTLDTPTQRPHSVLLPGP